MRLLAGKFTGYVLSLALAVVLISGCGRGKAGDGEVAVSGNIEITDARLGFKVPGLLVERAVDEGEAVQAGQLIARLDSSDLEKEVALREAEVRAAQAQLDELLAGTRPEEIAQAEAAVRKAEAALAELLAGSRSQEIAAAEATVKRAEAEAERARLDFERQQQLHRQEVISDREFEMIQANFRQTTARLDEVREQAKLVKEGPRAEDIEQARAALAQAQEQLRLLRNGPRREDIEQARARRQQTGENLALSQTRLGYTILKSPMSGIVMSKSAEPGEYLAPGAPVVTVGELRRVWVRAYVDEADLGRVKIGQTVRVTADTFPGKRYEGRIVFISPEAEFTPKTVQTEKERVKLVYRIKVDIANPEQELKPGMPVDAVITVAGR